MAAALLLALSGAAADAQQFGDPCAALLTPEHQAECRRSSVPNVRGALETPSGDAPDRCAGPEGARLCCRERHGLDESTPQFRHCFQTLLGASPGPPGAPGGPKAPPTAPYR